MIGLPYIFVDTGAWYALLDKSDANHHAAVKFKDSLVHPLVTSNYIADEVITLAFDEHFTQYGSFIVLPPE